MIAKRNLGADVVKLLFAKSKLNGKKPALVV